MELTIGLVALRHQEVEVEDPVGDLHEERLVVGDELAAGLLEDVERRDDLVALEVDGEDAVRRPCWR